MADWIAFDDTSVSALRRRIREEEEVQLGVGDPLEVSLAADEPSLVILPGDHGSAQVVTVHRGDGMPRHNTRTVATGFLGLDDAFIEEPSPAPKKSWWRRMLYR